MTDGRTEEAKVDWTQWQGRVQQAGIETFVLLREGVQARELESKISGIIERHPGRGGAPHSLVSLAEPITRSRLYARHDYQLDLGGDIRTLYLLGAIAALVLAIAAINFVNLATARSMNRAREVGMRKVVGAQRGQLMAQFLCETVCARLARAGHRPCRWRAWVWQN